MPVQRLPRFEMLLADYIRHTEEGHPDLELAKEGLKQIKSLTQFVNEHKRKADSAYRMMTVQGKIKGYGKSVTLLQPGRLLIREGRLLKISRESRKEKETYVFLFNDIIVCSKHKSKGKSEEFDYEEQLELRQCLLEISPLLAPQPIMSPSKQRRNSETGSTENCFRIILKTNGKEYLWKAASSTEKKGWINDIQNAIDAATSLTAS
eukprot:TRINITY_DN4074_c0_g1_i3.p2 TRINITY_DN4074_c0_g1~~TRINITY_DN4074_c0_g1_i3.p2  ORF type:complete len:207 (+),score=56.75 TRINITY_DN4074_c0_g1_i3:1056-1676(+)